MKAVCGAVVAVALTFGGVVACGDDSPSAADQVCDARSDLRESVDEVTSDLKAGNFGDAKDAAGDVQEDLTELGDALEDLGADQREQLQPQIDEIESSVRDLTSAASLDDLESQLDSIGNQISDVYASVTDELDCS